MGLFKRKDAKKAKMQAESQEESAEVLAAEEPTAPETASQDESAEQSADQSIAPAPAKPLTYADIFEGLHRDMMASFERSFTELNTLFTERARGNTLNANTSENAYTLDINVKDYAAEEISLETRYGYLIIQGVKQNKDAEQSYSSQFTRVFPLPKDVKTAEITADIRDDVLTINLPRDPALLKPRSSKIEINTPKAA